MINRNAICIVGAMAAAAAIIGIAMLAAWTFRADAGDSHTEAAGSLLRPRVIQDAVTGYVIAELYQDVHLDVESGVYGEDGALQGHHWSHDPAGQVCAVDLVVAVQQGRDELTLMATPTPAALDAVETYVYADPEPATGPKIERIDTTRVVPTPDPNAPAPPRPPLSSSVSWIGWQGRPIAIEADGEAALDAPRDADVSAHLSVWTGHRANSQTRLARLPLPDAQWENGQARIRLREASGGILLASDHIDARHRTARVRIEAAPLADCHGLRLRWEKPAAVVLKALTEQPYADWRDHELPPTPLPAPATLNGLTLTGLDIVPAFDPIIADYTALAPYATSETTVRPALAEPDDT